MAGKWLMPCKLGPNLGLWLTVQHKNELISTVKKGLSLSDWYKVEKHLTKTQIGYGKMLIHPSSTDLRLYSQ